jgi:hypothetical protein
LNSPSLNVQTYIDVRIVADLARVFRAAGVPHKGNYSHLMKEILKLAHVDWDAAHFTSPEEALAFLSNEGFSLSQLSDERFARPMLKALSKKTLEESGNLDEKRVDEVSRLFDISTPEETE